MNNLLEEALAWIVFLVGVFVATPLLVMTQRVLDDLSGNGSARGGLALWGLIFGCLGVLLVGASGSFRSILGFMCIGLCFFLVLFLGLAR